ncbi:uncharacterized protein LOC129694498 [Leucoraja erinacea]|uniref:uncharacterized protein LOC129694498 n=1 Tax=Leucoraja erinaceus TaxID=7782 RepID=UPI00245722BB|nr:uncharacterized protein LOC129694498 [Leucoraja erinacea]
MADAKRWKKECHKLTTEHQEKERQTNIVIQMLKTEMEALKDASEKKEKEMKQNMQMLANVILDMKLVHSDLSVKWPSDKGDCANSTCVKKTSQILSKIDGILSSMEGIFVCRESNNCSSGWLPGGDTGSKGVRDTKEMVPATINGRKHSTHEESWPPVIWAVLQLVVGRRCLKFIPHEPQPARLQHNLIDSGLAHSTIQLEPCWLEMTPLIRQKLQVWNLHSYVEYMTQFPKLHERRKL